MRFLFPLLALGLTAMLAPALLAQSRPDADIPRPTRTLAIENARIVQAPGREIARGTVVIRDGRILAVGADARVPADAQRIAGDSLVVYAGFIDALGYAGIPAPKREANLPRVENPDNPPADRAGRQPERSALSLVAPDDASIDALRKAGFTLAHTVPRDGFMAGQGALILLADRDRAADLVLRSDASLFATWQTGRGVYPSTPMGIMAAWRNAYRESERRGALEAARERGPAGRERVPFSASNAVFADVRAGTRPVFFYGDDALEAHRALMLQKDLGFNVVLAGLAEGAVMTDELKAARVPLVLTLALPEAPRGAGKTAADSAAAHPDSAHAITPDVSQFVSDRRTVSYKDVEGEKTNLDARSAAVREQFYRTAADLHAAGLAFSFATAEAKPADIHKNLRKMIEKGLPESVALAALTTQPAELLGLAREVGTVEKGKMANLVVTNRPFFDEKAQVRMVFIEGEPYTYEAPTPPKRTPSNGVAAASGPDPVGSWTLEIPSPAGGTMGATLVLTGTPDALAGTLNVDVMPGPATLENVVFDGGLLTFSFDGGQYGRISVTATLDGDTLDGTMDVPGAGGFPITGTRVPE